VSRASPFPSLFEAIAKPLPGRAERAMSTSNPRLSSELHEARAYVERARGRCPDACAARFLDLILQHVDQRISAVEARVLPCDAHEKAARGRLS
jgi:hypothetical protein